MNKLGKTIDFEKVLSKHALVWNTTPKSWYDAAFLGNGLIGATIYSEDEKSICFKVSRTDVTERRYNDIPLYGRRRLPIGELILHTEGKIKKANFCQNLYDASVSAELITDKGTIKLSSIIHSEDICLFIDMQTKEAEKNAYFTFRAQATVCPPGIPSFFEDNPQNPLPEKKIIGNLNIIRQRLCIGGYTTAWVEKELSCSSKNVFLSIDTDYTDDCGSTLVQKTVMEMLKKDAPSWIEEHKKQWHKFYEKSYISIPNKRLESLYWIQLYKLNSATRENRPAIDLLGPWYLDSPWQIIWWNLNIELTYWPAYISNHLELGESYCRLLDDNINNLSKNVPKEFAHDSAAIGRTTGYDCINDDMVGDELCDLPFALYNYWMQCVYSMDKERMKNKFYPLLKKTMAFYLHLLKKEDDGKYHLPLATSPEYPVMACDTNADIALLRWGLELLKKLQSQFDIAEDMLSRWNDFLKNLVDYRIDEYGLMIGKDVPFNQTHRHYSHLFAIYPLYIINWEQKENRDLIIKSLEQWMKFDEKLQGYSFTGASSIYSSIRQGNKAEEFLEKLMNSKVYPNTFYAEKGPCIETPLSAAKSVQDMLIQSWNKKIRVFPAIPDAWNDAAFYNLRTEGAYLVSAVRKDSVTSFIYVDSTVGGICEIEHNLTKKINFEGNGYKIKKIKENSVVVEFEPSGEIFIWSGAKPDMVIPEIMEEPVNYYGSAALMPVKK